MTTVLTITTLMSSANINLPPTAYPKSIGVFLAGCFIFTFLAVWRNTFKFKFEFNQFVVGNSRSSWSIPPPATLSGGATLASSPDLVWSPGGTRRSTRLPRRTKTKVRPPLKLRHPAIPIWTIPPPKSIFSSTPTMFLARKI